MSNGILSSIQSCNIKPHLTAIHRFNPSMPLQKMEHSIKQHCDTILDYGCGHGYDLLHLTSAGYKATGYDKYIKPNTYRSVLNSKYTVINCFYVLNVIPNIDERIEVLRDLLNVTNDNSIVYIAVRSIHDKPLDVSKYVEYNDGILTKRNTFQKYFEYDEFINLINIVFHMELYNIEQIKTPKNTIMIKITKKP